jgi:hypothetical protein
LLALQSSKVQTWLAQKVSMHLSKAMGVQVSIRSVNIHFIDRARIEGIYMEDLHQDTLLYLEEMDVNLDDIFLGFTHFSFDEVKLKNGQFNVRQFAGEEDLNIQFFLDFINGPKDTTDTTKSRPPEIFFWKLNLDHVDFTYEYRDSVPDTLPGFNQDLIRIRNINASLKRFMIVDDSLSGELRGLQCHDPNGFIVKKMDTDFIISYTMMDFAALNLQTPLSSMQGKIHFDYDSYDDLSDFIPKVQMRGRIRGSKIHTRDLAFFSTELDGLDQVFNLSGNFKGTVDDLTGKNVLLSNGKVTRYNGNFRLKGLPDTENTLFRFAIREFTTSASDIEKLPVYPFISNERINLPEEFDRLEMLSFSGELEGYISDFQLNGLLESRPGDLQTNLQVKYQPEKNQYQYRGQVKSSGLNTGTLLNMKETFGKAVFMLEFEGEGFNQKSMELKLNANLASFSFNGYDYQNVLIDGTVDGQVYNGIMKVTDPNLKLECSVDANLKDKAPGYLVHASLGKIDPVALHFFKADSSLSISAEILAEFSGDNLNNLEGFAEISESIIWFGSGKYRVDDLLVEASGNKTNRNLNLHSNILDAGLKGSFEVENLALSMVRVLNKVLPEWFDIAETQKQIEPTAWQATLKLKDTKLLSALFVPSIQLKEGANFFTEFNSEREFLKLSGILPSVNVSGLKFELVNLDLNSQGNKIILDANAESLWLSDSLRIRHLKTNFSGKVDSALFNLQWASKNTLSKPDARINFKLLFKDQTASLEILPSLILVEDTLWQVNEGNLVQFDTAGITIDNLSFSHQDEFIRLDGRIGENQRDELDIILDQFNLRNLNPFLLSTGIRFGGKANGIISLAELRNDPYFKSNLKFNSIKLNDDMLGDGQLSSTWIPSEKRIDLDGALIAANVPRLAFSGGFYPERSDNNLDLDVKLSNMRVDLFERYLSDIFSKINDGFADGTIHISGTPSDPVAIGSLMLKRTSVTVGLLNTTYSFTHEFKLEKNQIFARNVQLNDQQGNSALLDFKLTHKNFDNLNFDVRLSTKRIQALNTNELQSDLFYGTAFASGTFRAYGPIENIVMDITARTEKGTKFYLPLYDGGDISSQDFITFEQNSTLSKPIRKRTQITSSKGYELNFNLNITNDAEVVLIFDPQTGDVIQGRGTAQLRMEVTEAGAFNMYGDYTISSGNYQFNLVVSKPFDLQPGGTISFKGDPYDADINISAIYRVRTSLYNLVKNIDSSATIKRMIDVHAVMHLTDKLMKPQVSFDIVLPNADEATRNLLRSQIAGDDELNRQVFALIMLGNFWPNQGGANEIAGFGGANASELISSQLSNMLGRLSDDLKLGVNYKQGDADNTEELRLIWSTQLMGDRVLIDGNFGTAGIPQSAVQNTSNLVGEFTIEAKVNQDGTVRIKVFNRSNQYLLVFNGVPYTQGVGLFYRRDFEVFSDLKKKK